jgi:demethylmenaquinone methyltransferase/2-methoxy-6-polyprenyl-1,4-benzoquinol methylase
VWATDINESVLEIARSKTYPGDHVTFETADLYQIHPLQTVNALFGGFIWSHIPLQEMEQFLTQVNRLAGRRNRVVLMDNRYVEGSSSPITNQDEMGNTFQTRHLRNGEVFDVRKNFPEPSDFERLLKDKASDLQITWLPYFWICTYQTH